MYVFGRLPYMRTIGTLYAPVGKVIVEGSSVPKLVLDGQQSSAEDESKKAIEEIIRGINDDIAADMPFTTLETDGCVISRPPSDGDLDVLADVVAVRTKGMLLMSHTSPMLDEEAGAGQ